MPFTPPLGPHTPRRGGPFTRLLGEAVLRAFGFRFTGVIPDLPRAVMAVAPHTSNWDFVIGLAAKFALGLDVDFLGKHTLFRGLLGRFMRWAGGIPVDRSAPQGAVEQVAAQFRARPHLILALAPEGTRKKVDHWKSGFHRMARAGGVPIIPVALDWGRREVHLFPVFEPTDDYDRDLAVLRALFSPDMARIRANF